MTSRPTRGSAIDVDTSPGHRPPLRARARGRIAAVRSGVLRHAWWWLAAWSGLLVAAQVVSDPKSFRSWFFIVRGVHVLLGPHALSLYATHPELQMGPLTFLISAPFVLLPHGIGSGAAAVVMQAAGLVALREVRLLLHPGDPTGDRRWLIAAAMTMVAWTLLAVSFGHPDDVLALVGAVLGVRLLRSGAVLRAALVLGLAVDCKPWIAPLALVLLAAPKRSWLPAGLVLVVVVLAVWTPFLIQPGSLRATGFTIAVDPTATIRLLGLADGRTPVWCRPAQLLIGAVLVAFLARRGRPEAALLVVVVVRLLLDPSTHLYYDSGALLGASMVDLTAALPLATSVALAGVLVPPYLLPADDGAQAIIRLVSLLVLGGLALGGRRRRSTDAGRRSPSARRRPSRAVLTG
ncbi:MAG: hypothetical protein HIU86_04920 [Acidobacteria bacterium]|nr:hypothetical protein [Acidobacteriota bacterium]